MVTPLLAMKALQMGLSTAEDMAKPTRSMPVVRAGLSGNHCGMEETTQL